MLIPMDLSVISNILQVSYVTMLPLLKDEKYIPVGGFQSTNLE